jgi:hypothetical protein
MNTHCSSDRLEYKRLSGRRVTAHFDGGDITSDGGALLLRELDETHDVVNRAAACFTDHRDPGRVEHSLEQLLRQRVFGLALGYEDLNDHDELRVDPALAAAVGKSDPSGTSRSRQRDKGAPLAGKSTLNRLELSAEHGGQDQRYKRFECDFAAMENLLVDFWLEQLDENLQTLILDADATDLELHGDQEDKFYHGYYGHYCYLPLYIFAGDWLVASRLRRADQDASKGTLRHLEVLLERLRSRRPDVQVILRGDSGFARDPIMSWCEEWDVDFVLGLAKNPRLKKRIEEPMARARAESEQTGEPVRIFTEFRCSTLDSWSRERRVIAKSEYIPGKENPRFVVTSLDENDVDARRLYERLYCARGDAENRIREQLELFAGRMSTHWTRSNQVRLFLSGLAYILMSLLRRAAAPVGWEGLRPTTLRLRLLKIGAQVEVTCRRVWLRMSSSCPWQREFRAVFRQLTGG